MEKALAEIEDILRVTPDVEAFRQSPYTVLGWLGRAAAAIESWNRTKTPLVTAAINSMQGGTGYSSSQGYQTLLVLLHQAQHYYRMRTVGPLNVAIGSGQVFEYFDELRKILELAIHDVFFIDPYLDVEFVARYLPHIQDGAGIRLLTSGDPKRLSKLLPAVDQFVAQTEKVVGVRSTADLHDRYLFIDRKDCYHSGASFKDGARKAGTVISQIADAFDAMWTAYDGLWQSARVER
jgi:hypothetical protein